jgi:hypothetical protein
MLALVLDRSKGAAHMRSVVCGRNGIDARRIRMSYNQTAIDDSRGTRR